MLKNVIVYLAFTSVNGARNASQTCPRDAITRWSHETDMTLFRDRET